MSFLDCDRITFLPSRRPSGGDFRPYAPSAQEIMIPRSLARSTSRSDATTIRPGTWGWPAPAVAAGSGMLGTAITGHPAAWAEAMPRGESSSATHPPGASLSSAAARW
jgi:hypothetical protein